MTLEEFLVEFERRAPLVNWDLLYDKSIVTADIACLCPIEFLADTKRRGISAACDKLALDNATRSIIIAATDNFIYCDKEIRARLLKACVFKERNQS